MKNNANVSLNDPNFAGKKLSVFKKTLETQNEQAKGWQQRQ